MKTNLTEGEIAEINRLLEFADSEYDYALKGDPYDDGYGRGYEDRIARAWQALDNIHTIMNRVSEIVSGDKTA